MEIIQYKAVNKGALIATFAVKFKTEYGNLISRKMSHFKKENQEWISFGSEQYEKDNQKKYFQFCVFEDYSEGKIFQQDVIKALVDYVETSTGHSNGPSMHSTPSNVAAIPKPDAQEAFVF